ncbi:glycosyltransferase family 2 protein [Flavobacterium supellecticarium]|uniref:Glycosyltransferase family 2 protein n=1 Tax=Flavobacterium supellecticarium TaxID=2565924 RepID=A0A4S3ZXG2_9FLAO|nr:glycosyltransferase family 2 protein [Flavobacterium supellecticarium]THF50569.1 glycosyltransferase family 2 protein [Flavobacterium supellecticarium]
MLAIVIPYYKIQFFEETLRSLANQTDKRFMVYIGDDASPDDPLELLQRFSGQFPFEYHRFETNTGGNSLVRQWDRCIDLINEEEWIMILGDDDVLSENTIASWYCNYEQFKDKTNVVKFASKIIFQEAARISDPFQHPVWEKATESFFKKTKALTRSSLSEYIFTKKTYDTYGFYNYPLAWYSDDRAWIDFSEQKNIYTINESFVFIRFSEMNISGRQDNAVLKKKAKEQFFGDFILRNLALFPKKERLSLLLTYEVAVKDQRKLAFKEWLLLGKHYVRNFTPISFLKFIRRFFISTFKK